MELLNKSEIDEIIKQLGYTKTLHWTLTEFSNTIVGYLGEHLTLSIYVLTNDGTKKEIKCFVKCLPRSDEWKARYLQELNFFKKEYVMLNDLFRKFEQGRYKWRPTCLLAKEDVYVFEDVTSLGYKMPDNRHTLTLDELKASVLTLAKFHAQTYIFEEQKSKKLNRSYRIWDEYSEYLQEPERGNSWRNAGKNAVIDFLKVFSKHKFNPKFIKNVETVITTIYDKSLSLMKPSSKYRNAVVHRDLWTNNIFLKKKSDGNTHAMIVDFQTVIYCSPMLDLSSLVYFNTTRDVRESKINELIDLYYQTLSRELESFNFNINTIMDRQTLEECYDESLPFAIAQASIIVPIIAMDEATRERLFCDPDTAHSINEVSRTKEIIETAIQDDHYRYRVTDLFEEIVDRYILAP